MNEYEFMARFVLKLNREIEAQERDHEAVRINHFAYHGSRPDIYRPIYAQRVKLKQAIAQAIREAA